jgi:hypothetical protein
MTLPDERYRALVQTKELLLNLCNPKKTPRVPRVIREHAMSVLRHYPNDCDLEKLSIDMPKYFAKEIEPVTRMFMKYENKNA